MKNSQTQFKQTEIGPIPEDWEVDVLGNRADVIMGQSPESKYYNDIGEGLLFMQGVRTFGEKYPTFDTWTTATTKLAPANSVLISVRAPVGDLNITPKDMCIGRGLAAINAKNGNNEYIYQLLEAYREKVLGQETGTVYGSISRDDIYDLELPFAPDTEQQKIAEVFGALDEKIELNRKMNKTLESIGQAVFEQWFVDLEQIPENWQTSRLDKIADFLNGLALQKYPPENDVDYLPVIKIKELKSGISDNSDKASALLDPKYVVNNGDVLFSWSGSLEVILWTGGKGALNQHLFKVTSRQYPKWFYYYWIKHHLEDFQTVAAGKATTMGHIQRHHLSDAKVLIPDVNTFKNLNPMMEPIIDQLINNALEIETLSQTRDSLLPRLMSGKLRVI